MRKNKTLKSIEYGIYILIFIHLIVYEDQITSFLRPLIVWAGILTFLYVIFLLLSKLLNSKGDSYSQIQTPPPLPLDSKLKILTKASRSNIN